MIPLSTGPLINFYGKTGVFLQPGVFFRGEEEEGVTFVDEIDGDMG
jgi:hypothetical protein